MCLEKFLEGLLCIGNFLEVEIFIPIMQMRKLRLREGK